MNRTKLAVHLLVFYGKVLYDEKQKLISKSAPVQLIYGSNEWDRFFDNRVLNGISKATVERAFYLDKPNKDIPVESLERYEELNEKEIALLQDEVDSYFKAPEAELTPDQKKIKELEEKLEQIMAGGAKVEQVVTTKVPETPANNEALNNAKEQYEKLFGKKGGPLWTVEQYNAKIDEKLLADAREEYERLFGEKADDTLTLEDITLKINEKQ
ncbi:hypothetical protein [Elizabethkingia anophelis]|uniref:Uncharacterized protein n=1 Tax=Elizabethkingia anophelis TaxID=1117645 RepID=A0A494JCH3_9FLAO|nr:hypothetical protein [Elizabethkingia anophelis]AQX52423.1 hypothetical protein AYC66_17835 [Elizabethkingia anophelis]MDV3888455.1 hypothetical protein [Elizabethkingia anophelis]MDV4113883.1 hypothetical protein [Elizabethkingia anophelis]OPB53420.1 hypothetical protein BAY09_10925 [Elizabethkingia anophelis]RBA33130.1 hypothetical protein DSC50_12740 [Elizabethkingia anophelis]